jgi:hypothetical protein
MGFHKIEGSSWMAWSEWQIDRGDDDSWFDVGLPKIPDGGHSSGGCDGDDLGADSFAAPPLASAGF